MPSSPHNSDVLETKAHLGPILGLGSVSHSENHNYKYIGIDALGCVIKINLDFVE